MTAPRKPRIRDAAAGRPTRWGLVAVFALAALVGLAVSSTRAEEDPAAETRDILLASVGTDPEGQAERIARKARSAAAEGDADEAYRWLIRLAEDHGDALIPLAFVLPPGASETDGALRWPAYRAANLALVRLPEPQRKRLASRWGPDAGVLAGRAGAGDLGALTLLSERYGALEEGGKALRTLARLDVQVGRYVDAVRRLEAWLWLRPDAPAADRALAVAEMVDALHALDDAGGVLALAKRYSAIANERVTRGGRTTTLDALFWRKGPTRRTARTREAPKLPEQLVTVWSRSLTEASRYGESWDDPDPTPRPITAGAHVTEAAIVLHSGRHVARLDALTGVEAWRFPKRPLPQLPHTSARYLWPDIPLRTVTRDGDQVLVVLGDPGASGSYQWRDEIQESTSLRDELRLRLVALDVETGALRWSTGRHDDTHPVLGDLATGVASPPLVVGEHIYIGLAQRIGVGAYHLACLDRRTGRPVWVRRVGDGTSGRAPDRSDDDRFLHRHLQSLAWGARPALAGN
ncbi:MAG: PQQ-binding-like beta-propeller repeat protein, partial [Planctomycetota bacterium]|nr:PQQ-binding-like beta-propeller repeat protein [Planctomycetota bacterium]